MTPLRHTPQALVFVAALALAALLPLGCKPAPPSQATASVTNPVAAPYPPRTTVAPPPFKVFHQDGSTFTLVTDEKATDPEVEALLWQLRDAAHTRTFGKLRINQQLVDDRKPIVWFHIYRGSKCAAEKYAPGDPPCGASYHAAGDYTLGGYKNRDADSGVLLHDENHQIELWNPDAA